jgi:hypothetical protein
MGAPYWDARVRQGDTYVTFNLRAMDKKDRSNFHREFMNAYRASNKVAA